MGVKFDDRIISEGYLHAIEAHLLGGSKDEAIRIVRERREAMASARAEYERAHRHCCCHHC